METDKEILKKELSKWLADEYIKSHFNNYFLDEYWEIPDIGDFCIWIDECLLDDITVNGIEEFTLKLLENDITMSDIIPLAEELASEEIERFKKENGYC